MCSLLDLKIKSQNYAGHFSLLIAPTFPLCYLNFELFLLFEETLIHCRQVFSVISDRFSSFTISLLFQNNFRKFFFFIHIKVAYISSSTCILFEVLSQVSLQLTLRNNLYIIAWLIFLKNFLGSIYGGRSFHFMYVLLGLSLSKYMN